ncbi:hypothetical protein HALA3H3_130044 [Halomonas sp. A3H3]|jgi:type I restriction enzyme R subunit|nr:MULTISPECIES: hypothetical protein [Halomonas]CDG51216.1 hypothetical protein HALA3H3_130044 [Halomonas sp. A3H3]|tara:strand:+ start:1055 stop:1336 length:282 start_codon:yes stop_codon:yes gene_type:complete
MQQALAYSDALDAPFAFSSNGGGFIFHDRTGLFGKTETTLQLSEFPSPDTLWQLYSQYNGIGQVGSSRPTMMMAAAAHHATTRWSPSTAPSKR